MMPAFGNAPGQTAFPKLGSLPGRIYLPEGDYHYDQTIWLQQGGVLCGDGLGTHLIYEGAGNAVEIYQPEKNSTEDVFVGSGLSMADCVAVHNLRISGNGANQCGIFAENWIRCSLRNVQLDYHGRSGVCLYRENGDQRGWDMTLTELAIYNCGRLGAAPYTFTGKNGAQVTGYPSAVEVLGSTPNGVLTDRITGVTLLGCNLEYSHRGLTIRGGISCRMIGGSIGGQDVYGCYVDCRNFAFEHVYYENVAGRQLEISGPSWGGSVRNNFFVRIEGYPNMPTEAIHLSTTPQGAPDAIDIAGNGIVSNYATDPTHFDGIVIDPGVTNTRVGPNSWTPGVPVPGSQYLIDKGVGTIHA